MNEDTPTQSGQVFAQEPPAQNQPSQATQTVPSRENHPVQNPNPDPPQKHSSTPFIIAIVIAIIALIAAGVFYMTQIRGSGQNDSPSPTPTDSQGSPTPEATDTIELQTFIEQGSFRIDYPESWTLEGTVFYDAEENKVAEFAPGTYTPVEQVSCAEIHQNQIDGAEPIETDEGISISFERPLGEDPVLSNQITQIEGREWHLLSYETVPDGVQNPEPWYPHQYCTQENGTVFAMTFYERERENFNTKLHSQVLSNFAFIGEQN